MVVSIEVDKKPVVPAEVLVVGFFSPMKFRFVHLLQWF
jgi:hypothetical protein